jgi:hypothetical protein
MLYMVSCACDESRLRHVVRARGVKMLEASADTISASLATPVFVRSATPSSIYLCSLYISSSTVQACRFEHTQLNLQYNSWTSPFSHRDSVAVAKRSHDVDR